MMRVSKGLGVVKAEIPLQRAHGHIVCWTASSPGQGPIVGAHLSTALVSIRSSGKMCSSLSPPCICT